MNDMTWFTVVSTAGAALAIAVGMIGGLAASTFVTLFVTPSLYAIWRHWQLRRLGHVTPAIAAPTSLETDLRG